MLRPTLIEIDLGQLNENIKLIKSVLPVGTLLMAVVKANAYGHGMIETAHSAVAAGAAQLAVALCEEGIALREAGFTEPILVLGPAFEAGIAACVKYELTQTVMDAQMVDLIDRAAQAQGKIGHVHIKIDTGMNRIGVRDKQAYDSVVNAIRAAKHLTWTGVFTHFADADGVDDAFTLTQLERFLALTRNVPKGVLRHTANSAAILRYPDARLDMVRAGIAMYGCPPVNTELKLKPAMCFKTAVSHLKTIHAGDTVSYGRTYEAAGDRRIATLPVGYGDGYHRAISGKGRVLVNGQFAKIVGRVCMDQIMVDVSDIPNVHIGSEVILMGRDGDNAITPDDVAAWAGTISYEVLLAITPRVPRRYING